MPPKVSSAAPRVLYWFRTDLRLHDSPALHSALHLKPSALFPVWCWDPTYVYQHRVGVNRFRFLLESMSNLASNITSVEPLSTLLVVRGEPTLLLPELVKRWSITHVVFESDPTGYSARRDAKVKEIFKGLGIEVMTENGHWLYDPEEVVKKHGGRPLTSMSQLQKAVSSLPNPPKPLEAPKQLPPPLLKEGGDKPKSLSAVLQELAKSLQGIDPYIQNPGPPEVDLNAAANGGERQTDVTCYDQVQGDKKGVGAKKESPADPTEAEFAVPTLASLGMDPTSAGVSEKAAVAGGEEEALKRLEKLLEDPAYLATFAKPKTSPSSDYVDPSTTLMSPFIKFGCIGIRRLYYDVKEAIAKHKRSSKTSVPENYEGQLLFREMYAACEVAVGPEVWGGIRGNKVSRYIDWYLPTHYDSAGKVIEPRPKGDAVSEERLEKFKHGQTGFPWIDASMRCLKHTGWIHHLARHSVAAFLTRGQCWISWERGAEIFEEFLLDWDPSSNAGNWMWLSCSAFFAQYFRLYGLVTFPSKYDKHGYLVRKYCPELKDFPDKYIYNPWEAPLEVQKKAKCIIGTHYPRPMLDEKETKAASMERMKVAYAAGYHGDAPKVLDGSAEKELRKKHGQPDPEGGAMAKMGTNAKQSDWTKMGFAPKSEKSAAKRDTSEKEPKEEEEEQKEAPKAKKAKKSEK